MNRLISLIRTIYLLGFNNCLLVILYRLGVRSGYYKSILPIESCSTPELTYKNNKIFLIKTLWALESRINCLESANHIETGTFKWFSKKQYKLKLPPNWFIDPFAKNIALDNNIHWVNYRHFPYSDVKRYWELSRWSWAPLLVRAWKLTGEKKYLNTVNRLTVSWCKENSINEGVNWLCGQEVSIRLLHAFQAWLIADETISFPEFSKQRFEFINSHLKRISATIIYAKAQQNNHWISESAALFIGGSWLTLNSKYDKGTFLKYASMGRIGLEESIDKLIMSDGSFSQHSSNYHRLLLDTLTQVEFFRKRMSLSSFSNNFYNKSFKAIDWLAQTIDPISGDAPNLGGNDGAFCYQLHDNSYRDFRPTLQLASVVFKNHKLLRSGPWDEPLYWLKLDKTKFELLVNKKSSKIYMQGGYAILAPKEETWSLLRLPNYLFRPANSDPLHLDLWHKGINILRDGGTFSYNSSEKELRYFTGIKSHNSVEFDQKEPMPILGRFLLGDWLNYEQIPILLKDKESTKLTASYVCSSGRHLRKVETSSSGNIWHVVDHLSYFKSQAILRWRLVPSNWEKRGNEIISDIAKLTVCSENSNLECSLSFGWESKYYDEKSKLPVMKIKTINNPSIIKTTIELY